MNKRQAIELSETDYREYTESYTGVCLACGETRECCEPDARRYRCDACGAREVFGTEQALLEGYVTII